MNGWAPRSVTYGPDGGVVSVTVSEPRFTPGERDLLLAARRKDVEPRGGHGHLLSEAMDKAHQYEWDVDLPSRDFAQAAIDRAREKYREAYGDDADMGSLLWRVTRR